jgi:hypothetical protein
LCFKEGIKPGKKRPQLAHEIPTHVPDAGELSPGCLHLVAGFTDQVFGLGWARR